MSKKLKKLQADRGQKMAEFNLLRRLFATFVAVHGEDYLTDQDRETLNRIEQPIVDRIEKLRLIIEEEKNVLEWMWYRGVGFMVKNSPKNYEIQARYSKNHDADGYYHYIVEVVSLINISGHILAQSTQFPAVRGKYKKKKTAISHCVTARRTMVKKYVNPLKQAG